MVFGMYPFRCIDCGSRFLASIWLLSRLPYANCPRCLSMDLIPWPAKYFAPHFWNNLAVIFGAQRYRCQPCRKNFVSFRRRFDRAAGATHVVVANQPIANAHGESEDHVQTPTLAE